MSDRRDDQAPDAEDEALLADLSALAAGTYDDGLDPRWDDLALGDLSAEDEATLRALAAEDPTAADALEAFAPFDDSERADFAAVAMAALDAGGDVADAKPTASAEPAPTTPADNVVQFPLRRAVVWVGAGVALAAAALVFVWRPAPEALPAYGVTVRGGLAVTMAETPEGPPKLGPDERLTLVLTPAVPLQAEVEVRAFVEVDGEPRPWSPPIERSAEGAVRIDGTAASLGLGDFGVGQRRLHVIVGRSGSLPDAPPSERRGAGWQALAVDVDLIR